MKSPVRRKPDKMVITSPFGMRVLNGKKRLHRGIDLRTIRFLKGKGYVPQWSLQKIQATEKSMVLRFGTDGKGNDFIVLRPLESNFDELKFIHVTLNDFVKEKGMILEAGDPIGKTQVKGTSKAHHLHFETWQKNKDKLKPVDPILYFESLGIKYRYK